MRVGDRFINWARLLAGEPGRRDLSSFWAKLEAVNTFGSQFRAYSDSQLQDQIQSLRVRIRGGVTLEQIMAEAFALIGDVSARTIGLRPYDVQIIASIGLFEGRVVEMQTGEGKTLAAVSPVCLNAFQGSGVHILTFNDYLARRDAEWMGPIYRFLGLTVGFIGQGMSRAERKRAYEADVTYLAAKEAGFDFLRDELAYEVGELVHRPLHMAVVDEADSILIDEARIPLVIAGGTEHHTGKQVLMRDVVKRFASGVHYSVDEGGRSVYMTEEGAELAEQLLECEDLYSDSNLQLLTELNLALHARVLMKRDVDYIVRQGRVEIVDVFTGRVTEDRHWPFGLQTAIEVKEGVQPSEDAQVLGSITVQNFIRQYPNLCGMTATAESAAKELFKFYELEVLVVPPNRRCARIDHPDRIFADRDDKQRALLAEIETAHRSGRPVLAGTTSVEESETLASDLERFGIKCNILNATRDDQEARIVAEAGDAGAITISTNMAGRGTDIRLGGHSGVRYDQVRSLGGLYVLGTNRHDSLRIDCQLRGRAGRQGDPGSSRFFISLQDDLLTRNGIDELLPKRWRSLSNKESLDNSLIRRTIVRVQRIEEGQNFDIRQTLWRYSRVVE
jgi:preprotein translocase subunit SecA